SNVVASSNPFDGSNLTAGGSGSSTGSSTTVSSGTVAPTSATDLLIAGLSTSSGSASLTFSTGSITNGFVLEAPTGTVNGGATGAQRVAQTSADKKTSSSGNSTSMTVGSAPLGWRGQIAAFKTKTDTTTTVSSPGASVVGQAVTFTATVSP